MKHCPRCGLDSVRTINHAKACTDPSCEWPKVNRA